MAYVALYRTWRPQDFDDLVGQEPIKKALTNALETGRISHAYLFAGPRGTGKTSTARILAKALNCEKGPTAHPCNQCTNCREITEGTSSDVVEIDAASNRGIDEIRKLREQVYFAPVSSRYKVYIIDEVHMITTDAFNALLKTLEEPPEHVVFILATTEPQKILNTILSRCQRFDFHRATVDEIAAHLAKVAKGSHIEATPEALRLMAIQADGGLRDALSLLDQCSVMARPVTEETVRQVLGLVGREKLRQLITQIGHRNLSGALDSLNQLLEQGKEMEQILAELMEYFRALLLFQADRDYQEIYLTDTREALEQAAGLFTRDQIVAHVERIHEAVKESRYSLRKKIVGELCLFDLCKERGNSEAALLARIDTLEQQVAALTAGGIPAAPVRPAVAAPVSTANAPAVPVSTPIASVQSSAPAPAAAPVASRPASRPSARQVFAKMAAAQQAAHPAVPAAAVPEPAPEAPSQAAPADSAPVAPQPAAPAAPVPSADVQFTGSGRAQAQQLWQLVLQGLKRRRKRTFLIYAEMAKVADFQGQTLLMAVSTDFGKEKMEEPSFKNLIQDILKEATGQPIRLEVMQAEGEITLNKPAAAAPAPAASPAAAAPAPAPAPAAAVPEPPAPEAAPLPPEPEEPPAVPEPAPVANPEPTPPAPREAAKPATPATPVKPSELPDGVKKAMQVFGGEVYKE